MVSCGPFDVDVAVQFFMSYEGFAVSSLPLGLGAYIGIRFLAVSFIESRNRRVSEFSRIERSRGN